MIIKGDVSELNLIKVCCRIEKIQISGTYHYNFLKKHTTNWIIFTMFVHAWLAHLGWVGKHIERRLL